MVNLVPSSSDRFAQIPQAWTPADHGLVSWTGDPDTIVNTAVPATGTLYTATLKVPVDTTITNILLTVAAAGTGLAAGQSFAGLYSAAGVLLSGSADQSTAFATVGTKVIPLTTPQVVAAGKVIAAFYQVGSANLALGRGIALPIVNVGLASPYRFGSANSGLTTALPSALGTINPSPSAPFWMALS